MAIISSSLKQATQTAGVAANYLARELGLVAKLRTAKLKKDGVPLVVYGLGRTAAEAKGARAVQLQLDCDPCFGNDACWMLSAPSGGRRNILERGQSALKPKKVIAARPEWFKEARRQRSESGKQSERSTERYLIVF